MASLFPDTDGSPVAGQAATRTRGPAAAEEEDDDDEEDDDEEDDDDNEGGEEPGAGANSLSGSTLSNFWDCSFIFSRISITRSTTRFTSVSLSPA